MEVLRRLAHHARTRPDGVALDDSGATITWRELDASVGSFALLPAASGAAPGDRIASFRLPAAAVPAVLLGTWASGAVAVPLEAHLPVARIRLLLERSGARLLVAAGRSGAGLARALGGEWLARTILIDAPDHWCGGRWDPSDGVRRRVHHDGAMDTPASILFTSGSTGTPKGVTVPRRAVDSFAVHWSERLELGPEDRVAQAASPAFDLSLFEIASTVVGGAVGLPFGPGLGALPGRAAERLREARATVWYTVPSLLLRTWDAGGLRSPEPRILLYAGESMAAADARRLRRSLPNTRLFNLFGPTETNVSTAHEVPLDFDDVEVPIGTPCPYVDVVLRDGEIMVAGDTVMSGYWGEADRARWTRIDGRSFLHTGDRAVRDADGILRFRGRLDRLVKIRGYRVEPEEVERALAGLEGVSGAAVLAIDGALVAVVEAAEPSARRWATALAEELPAWAVPSRFEAVEALPRTPRGKVDVTAVAERLRGTRR